MILKISFLKPSKIKKIFNKNLKVVKINQIFCLKKTFLLLKYQKTVEFFGQKSKKKSCFSRCFYMESP